MDYVFIDTNIIKKEQYFKPGNKIQTLKSLALKNMIGLVTTEITVSEIKANLYGDLTSELACISKKEALLGHLTEFRLPKISDIRTRVDNIVDEFFEGENIYILGYDYCDDVATVFSQYFSHQFPFGENKKKNEFPDAFVLSALEKFSSDNDDCEDKDDYRYVVLSLDSDIKNYKSIDIVCIKPNPNIPSKPQLALVQVKTCFEKNIPIGFTIEQCLKESYHE